MFVGTSAHFPFVLSAVRGDLDDNDVERLRAFYTEVHTRGRFVNMVDARAAKRPNSVVREKLTAFSAAVLADTKELQVANAIILDGPLTTGVMTALRWAVPAPVPERYFSTIDAGMTWLDVAASKSGLVITSAARAVAASLARDPQLMLS